MCLLLNTGGEVKLYRLINNRQRERPEKAKDERDWLEWTLLLFR